MDTIAKPFGLRSEERTAPQAPAFNPVRTWAFVGACFIALQLYVFAAWIISGDATPTPTGADDVPTGMVVGGIIMQVLSSGGAIAGIWWFAIRPLRREGRLTLDGLLVLSMLTLYWQDPMLNYVQPWTTYNSSLVNFGSWAGHIPGWSSPNGNLFAEPVLFSGPAYVSAIFVIACVGGPRLMRALKSRWPRLGWARLSLICFAVMCVGEIIVEVGFMRVGLYSYPGSPPSLSLFAGHYYQLPIHEIVIMAGLWTVLAMLRYFTDDQGRTIVERGTERLTGSARRRQWIRFLALAGTVNVIVMVTYSIPAQLIGIHSAAWPKDVVERSYLTDGLCGPGTTYACPGPDLPIARKESRHLTPDGSVSPP